MSTSLRAVRRQVEAYILITQARVSFALAPPCQGTDARQQFLKGKRLAQVVIRPAVQPAHPIGHGIARRKEQDRRCRITLPKTPQQTQAVLSWKPPV